MPDFIIYHNPRCSKSRQALEILKDKGIQPEIIQYLDTPLNEEQLIDLVSKLNGPASQLVRTKEDDFKNSPFNLDDTETVIKELAKNPNLLERPVVIHLNKAIVGRPPEKIMEFFH